MVRATATALVCVLLGMPALTHAQQPTGSISGVVLDGSTGDAIIEAGVEVMGAGIKTRTDLDGKYSVKVPAGTYELRIFAPLYQGTRLKNVIVAPSKDTTANANLKPEGEAAVEVVEVVAEAKKAAEQTQLLQRKAAPVVSDSIGAEEVKKSPDSDAAEVVQRLPSITISEDNFVFVRGLGDRYSIAVLNSSRLPSIDPDRRVVPLDIFPADFVDAINVVKTYVPNLPGDFSGGLVDIALREPPDRLTYGIGMSAGINTQSTFKNFDTYKGGRYDYFGFGKDYRTPDNLPDTLSPAPGQPPIVGGGAEQRRAAGLFRNIWNVDSETAPPDFDLNFNVGNAWGPFSVALGGKYKNEYTIRWNEIVGDLPNSESLGNQFTYKRSLFDTQLGGTLTGAWKISPDHKVNLRSFVVHTSQDEVLDGQGFLEAFGPTRQIFPTVLEYEEGKLGYGQLSGAHHTPWVDIDWRSALSQTTKEEPDRRFVRYQAEGGTRTLDSQPPSLLREFTELDEVLTDSAIDLTVPFPIWSALSAKFRAGVAYAYRDRDFALRRFQYEQESGVGIDSTASPEELLQPNNIGTNFSFTERTARSDSFKASQEIAAFYGMFDLPIIRDRLRLIAGVRLEYSYIRSEGGRTAVIGEDPVDFKIPINDLDPLPAINLVYSPRDDMNVRFGWSRTVSRPEFRELQPTFITAPLGERPLVGNPDLVSANVESFDLRWEWFFADRELVSLSGFYKDLTDPIEQVTLKFGTFNADGFTNANSGELYGFEVEARKDFDVLAPLFERSARLTPAIPYLQNLRLILNVAYIESSADVQEEFNVRRDNPLQGQPDFVINAALEYEQLDVFTTRLLYYTVGERLASVGIVSEDIPDSFDQRRDQLDFVMIKPFKVFGTPLSAKLSVENILNDQFLQTQEDFIRKRYTTGVKTSFGLSYSF